MSNTQTTSTSIPDWITGPAKTALGDISSWLKSPENYVYGTKQGEKLYTPLTQSQNESIGNINWLADQNLAKMFGIDKAGAMWDKYASTPANTITGSYANKTAQGLDTERVVDQNGFLGKISDYMNPYLQQVLNPQIKAANEQLQRGRRDLGANAQMSGAFGDARHGVVEQGLYDDTQENIADLTGRTYASGFDTAMGLRANDIGRKDSMDLAKAGYAEGDVNRLLTRDTLNQAAREAATERLGTGAKATTDLGQTSLKNFMDVNDALFNAGDIQRDAQEEQRVAVQKFQELIKNKKFDDALKMLGALQGTQYPTSSTSEQSSNDGAMGWIGALLGSLF
jgi:hypothetical protein